MVWPLNIIASKLFLGFIDLKRSIWGHLLSFISLMAVVKDMRMYGGRKKPEPFMNCVLETREMFALNLAMIHRGDLDENFGSYLS